MKNIELLGDRLVIKQDEPDATTKLGIILPKTAEKQIMSGVVLSVGSGRWVGRGDKAIRQEMVIKEGDKVLFPRYTGMNFKESTLILRQRDIICVMKDKDIFPIGDRVVVKPGEVMTETNSGLVLPDSAKEKPHEGEVIATGPGKTLENDLKLPLEVKVGDTVIYSKFGGVEIKVDDEPYMVLQEHEILAKRRK